MARLLKLPEDLASGEACVTMHGSTEAIVENYRGILEYTPEKILIQTRHANVELFGENLCIAYYNAEEMKIRGVIQTVHYQ